MLKEAKITCIMDRSRSSVYRSVISLLLNTSLSKDQIIYSPQKILLNEIICNIITK